MSKRILITGASGFIGSFLVEKALECGFETFAGIRASSNRGYLTDKRIRFIDLQFSTPDGLRQQLQDFAATNGKFDYIIHNAGITKATNSSDFEKVNFQFTANFIDALIETDNIPAKFIFMSSLSVMGPGDEQNYTPISLSHTPAPNTMYGKSKLKAEEYLRSKTNFPSIILRPTGVYGPREKDYFLMIKTIQMGLDVSAGMQEQRLTFIYVRDLVDAVFLALQSPIAHKSYFVTDGDVYTDQEYTSLIKEITGKKMVLRLKIPLILIKAIACLTGYIAAATGKPATLNSDKFRIMKQRNWTCETEPLHTDLGFKAQYNLREGLSESIRWYKENHWL